jgi:hypothetical protein
MDRYAPAALTLIDGDISIKVRPPQPAAADPVWCTSWDLGAPEVRVTSTPRPGADGIDETSGYLGSRTVTMDLLIRGDGAGVADGHDAYWYSSRLAGMCHPTRRPVLRIDRQSQDSKDVAYFMGLRGNPWSQVIDKVSASRLEMTLTFTCPSGVIESDLHTVASTQANPDAATDWHFPAHFPHGFGAATGAPILVCDVAGSSPVSPVLYISGPAKNPRIADDLGQKFEFTGLTLAAGQTVQIDMGAGTALVANPDTGWTLSSADVFHTIDFTKSTFWTWPPGPRRVNLLTSSGSFAAQWRDRLMTI